jgi:hypothetical protein
MNEAEIKEQLMSSSIDFRRLAEEHHRYENKLQEMRRRTYQSEQDHLEAVNLKKKKLLLKDRMNEMVNKLLHGLSHQPS